MAIVKMKKLRVMTMASQRDEYCWDERGGRDAPRKENDHAMDDLRYFAMDLAGEGHGGFAATCVERRI